MKIHQSGAPLLNSALTLTTNPEFQMKLLVAAFLLGPVLTMYGGCITIDQINGSVNAAVQTAIKCVNVNNGVSSGQCGADPATDLHPSRYQVGSTVTARGQTISFLGNTTPFVRAGVVTPIDRTNTASLENVGAIAATGGEVKLKEHASIPLMLGGSVPAQSLGIPNPNLSFEAFAGAVYKMQTLSANVTEAGFANSATGSTSYQSLNPMFGVGFQYRIGSWGNVPVSFGMYGAYDLPHRQEHVIAYSPNFANTAYSVSSPLKPNFTLGTTLNFDIYSVK